MCAIGRGEGWAMKDNKQPDSFAEAVKKRYEYKHLSDFGYQIIVVLGCPEFREELIALNHMRVTVPDKYVEAVKKLAYEYTPVVMRTDVVGSGAISQALMDHEHLGSASGETTAPQDEPKPNHVRDAVRANQ
jgi:hypothetical protein